MNKSVSGLRKWSSPLALALVALAAACMLLPRTGLATRRPQAVTYYVCAGADCGGLTTHASVTAALADAVDGDTILVAAGTYTECVSVSASVTLQGGWSRDFALHDPGLYTTTLRGSGYCTVIAITGDGPREIRDLTITGGKGYTGGGISISYSAATIVGNRIVQNESTNVGGGIAVQSQAGMDYTVLISGNQIISNTIRDNSYRGGGIYAGAPNGNAYVTIAHNEIRGNVADEPDTSDGRGGGMYLWFGSGAQSTVIVDGNLIAENQADPWWCGGGVVIEGNGVTLTNNIILGNRSTRGAGICTSGGGNAGFSRVINNTIVANHGDAIAISNPFDLVVDIRNNVIAYNDEYGIFVHYGDGQTISYNDLWDNATGNYTRTADMTGIDGNISSPPLFVDAAGDDWRLGACSPLIDAGTNAGAPAMDYAGTSRPFNGVTDIGAYEYTGGGVCFRIYLPLTAQGLLLPAPLARYAHD